MFYHDLELQCLAWGPSKRRMDCLLLWSRGSLLPPGCLGRVPVVPSGPSSAYRPGEIATAGDEHDETIEGEGWRESWWIWVRKGAHHALHLRCSESACPLLELAFESFWVFGNDHRLGSMSMNSGNQMYIYILYHIWVIRIILIHNIYIYAHKLATMCNWPLWFLQHVYII